MIRTFLCAATLALIAGASAAETAPQGTVILKPAGETAGQATRAAAGGASAPVQPGAESKASGGGCGYSARTAYLGS
jgi:hypothetical protein